MYLITECKATPSYVTSEAKYYVEGLRYVYCQQGYNFALKVFTQRLFQQRMQSSKIFEEFEV